jgi:glutathione S-transferase
MKLYYSKGACSLAVRIAINEMNIPCQFEAVDLKTKKTASGADYLTINLKGSVPALQLDNQQILTENTAIQQYLAEEHKATAVLPPLSDPKRYQVLEWLSFVSTELHKGCGPFFNPNMPEAVKEEVFKPALKNKLKIADQHLSKNKYLTGDQFTLPDGYLFVVLTWLPYCKLDLVEWPNLSRYFSELKDKPSIQQSLQQEGITTK